MKDMQFPYEAPQQETNAASESAPRVGSARSARDLVFRIYDRAVELVILGVIPLMLVSLGFAFIQALISTASMFPLANMMASDEAEMRGLVERVLDVVILIELFNTFMEYARTRHIRLSNLLDVTIVFSLREVLIQLYAQVFSATDLLTLCALVIVLVIARSIATWSASQGNAHSGGKRN